MSDQHAFPHDVSEQFVAHQTSRLTYNATVDYTCEQDRHDELDNHLGRFSISDQDVDGIVGRLCTPPSLDVAVDRREEPCRGKYDFHSGWAGKPRYDQGSGGGARLEGHKQFSDFLEVGLVLCQVMTRGHARGHEENELKN